MKKRNWPKSRNLKRFLAVGLSVTLSLSNFISVMADVKASDTSEYLDGTEITKKQLKDALAQDKELYPDGAVEFFSTQIAGKEGGERQHLIIVRRGGNDKEATVNFKAIDVSASYGKDYLLTVEESASVSRTLDGTGKPLSDFNKNEMEVLEQKETTETETQQSVDSDVRGENASNGTALQKSKDQYVGSDSSNLDWQELDNAKTTEEKQQKEAYDKEYNEFADNVEGTDYTFTFKKGEYMKSVYIDIIDDNISETDEQAMFVLSNPTSCDLAGSKTAYLNIADNDENEKAIFAMDTKEMMVDRSAGKATVVINRVSGVNKIASVIVGTGGKDAVSGTDYESVQKEVVFAQGVTQQTVDIPLKNYAGAPSKAQFQVALDANQSFVQEDSAITTITLTNTQKTADAADTALNNADGITADANEWTDTRNLDANVASAGIWGRENKDSGWKTVLSGLDLSTASQIIVDWVSSEGSTYKSWTEGSGCNKKNKSATYNGRNSYVAINRKTIKVRSDVFGWNNFTYDLTAQDKVADSTIDLAVVTKDNNATAVARIRQVKIIYPGYTFRISNTLYTDADTGYSNQYTEKIYTDDEDATLTDASGHKYKNGNTISLGTVQVSKDGGAFQDSVRLYKCSDKITFNNTFTSNKTSNGVQIKEGYSGNVYLAGYQLFQTNSKSWSKLIPPEDIKLTTQFISTYKDYLFKGNEYVIRPVYRPYDARVYFQNGDTKKGSYANGFKTNEVFRCTTLDTIKVTGIANKGYSVAGFNLGVHSDGNIHKQQDANSLAALANNYYAQNNNTIISETKRVSDSKYKKVNVTTAKKDDAIGNIVTFTPTGEFTYISPIYSTPKVDVKIDPQNNSKDKGAVVYTEDSASGETDKDKIKKGDYKNPLVINGVTLNQEYTLNAVAEDGFKAYFKNFTGDVNGDGKITTAEEKVVSKYSFVRTASNGNAYTFRPIIDNTLLYYGFNPIVENRYSGYIDGIVMIDDKPIFGKSITSTPVNGAQVSVAGLTTATKTDEKFGGIEQNGGDGYFSLSSRDFVAGENQTINISYNNLYLTATQAVNAAGLYHLDAYDTIGVNGATAYIKDGSNYKSINANTMENGDYTYRLALQTYSKVDTLRAAKAVFKFFRKDGSELSNAAQTVTSTNGTFTLDFNPKTLGVTPGATMTVQFYDQNGTGYFEHDMGFSFAESLGVISFLSSFNFGGAEKALEIIGTIDSAFNFGWDGDLNNISTTDEDGNVKTISIGYEFSTSTDDDDDKEEKKDAVEDAAKNSGTSSEQKTKQKEAADNAIDKDGKNNTSKAEIGASAEIKLSFGLEINIAKSTKSEHKGEWYFRDMMLCATVEGGVDISIKYVTPIGIPVLAKISVGGSGAATFIIDQNYDKDEYYISNVMDKTAGKVDIFNFNMNKSDRAFDAYGIFNISPYIDLSAGAGFDFLNLMIGGRADFNMNFYTRSDQQNTGDVTFSAYISLKILFFTKKWDIAKKTVNMFGQSSSIEEMSGNADYTYESLSKMEVDNRDYQKNASEWLGDKDASAQSVASTSGLTESLLKKGINPNPDIKLAEISDGKYLALFLDDDTTQDTYNCTHLYFSIYSDDKWSEPVMVENDKTTDDAPNIFDLGDKGFYVAWSSADRQLTKDDSVISTLNSMNIHGTFFDKTSMTFGDIQEITSTSPYSYKDADGDTISDSSADVDPHISYDATANKMIMYYTKTEYTSTATDDQGLVGDIAKPYSVIAYRVYDMAAQKWVDTYDAADNFSTDYTKAWYGQRFLELSPLAVVNETLDESGYWTKDPEISKFKKATYVGKDGKTYDQDPIVIESTSTTYNGLSVFAYVLDYDGDKETANDRDIFMQIYNYSENTFSHPIMVTTTAGVPESNIQFGRCGNTTLLTYIADNTLYSFNISYAVKYKLLKTTVDNQEFYYIDKSIKDGEVVEEDHLYMPPAVVAGNKLKDVTPSISGEDSEAEEKSEEDNAIVDYRINATDNYIYAVWTQKDTKVKEGIADNSEESLDAANRVSETQMYIARYDTNTDAITSPVQITDEEGANYGNLDFVVNKGDKGSIELVGTKAGSKVETSVVKDDSGKEVKNDIVTEDTENKSLIAMKFTPVSTLQIQNVGITELTAGTESGVRMDLFNDGLETLTDLKLTVKDGSGKEVYTKEIKSDEDDNTNDYIFGGRTEYVSFPITLGEDETGCKLTYEVTDKSGAVIANGSYSEEIPVKLDVTEFKASTDERGKIKFNVTVMNNGRCKSGEQKIDISRKINEVEDKYSNVTSITTGNILPSESANYEVTYDYGNYNDMFRTFITKDSESLEALTYFKAAVAGDGESAMASIKMTASKEQRLRMSAIMKTSVFDGAAKEIGTSYSMDKGTITQLNTGVDSLSYSGSRYEGNDDADNYDKTNSAGLKVAYQSDNEDVVKVYDSGFVEAVGEGKANVTAYVMPSDNKVVYNTETGSVTEDNFATLPQEAMILKNFTVNVGNGGVVTPISDTKIALSATTYNWDGKAKAPTVKVTNKAGKTLKQGTDYTLSYSKGRANVGSYKVAVKGKGSYSGTVVKTFKISLAKGKTYSVGGYKYTITKNYSGTKAGTVTLSGVSSKKIKSAKVASSVKLGGKSFLINTIGSKAFSKCTSLTKVTIGANVKTIGASAFEGCSKLKAISILSKNIKSVGKYAVKGANSKLSIKVPSGSVKAYKKLFTAKAGFGKSMSIK